MGRPGVGQGRLGRRLAAHWHPRRPGDPHRCHTLDTCPAASSLPSSPAPMGAPPEVGVSQPHFRWLTLGLGKRQRAPAIAGTTPWGRRWGSAPTRSSRSTQHQEGGVQLQIWCPAWDRQNGDHLALPRWGGGLRPNWRPDWHLLCPAPAGQLHCPRNRNFLPLPVNMTHPGGRSSILSTFSEPHFLQAPMATWPLPQGAHRP